MQDSYKVLIIQIEKKREEMILTGKIHGLTSPKTLYVSQQLDQLLNRLQHSNS
jgi:hypothetical protein